MTERLTIQAFDGTTRLKDPRLILEEYSNLNFTTGYPGGLYLNCRFRLPIASVGKLPLKQGNKIKIFSQAVTVWEGVVSEIIYHDAIDVNCIGYWGALLMRRNWQKNWADSRITDAVWKYTATASAADKCFVDRNERIRFTPKAEAWTTNQVAQVRYDAPTGMNIARIEYDYDLAENSPTTEWSIVIRDIDNTSSVVTVSDTGSASGQSHDFSPVTTAVGLWLQADGNQTPPSDGTEYGEFSNITIVAEFEGTTAGTEGTLNIAELCYDTIDKLTGSISASTALIDSGLTNSIKPFISNQAEPIANILIRAASYGDTSNNPVAVGLRASDRSPDDLPILFAEQYPVLTDYEYILGWQDDNRVGGSMARSIIDLSNYIWVEYQNEQGFQEVAMPDDDASLTDTTSSGDTWGQLDQTIRADQAGTEAQAVKWGARYLARFKDLQWAMKAPVRLEEFVLSKYGARVPASQVRAGQRIRIQDFAESDQVFVITHTRYDDERGTLSLSAGIPPLLFDRRLLK